MDQKQQITKACLNCPRCNSTNTKFCYYNNYSLSQPRHFCKACKRYWTKGGTLRNVPVGGGCRKNGKRTKSRVLPSSASTLSSILVDASSNQVPQIHTPTIPAASQGASSDVLTPLLFDCYKDLMIHQQQQPSKIYSDMNTNTDRDPTDAAFFSSFNNPPVEYHTLQNATPPPYSTSRSQADQLLARLFPFPTMQQQEQQSSSTISHIGDQQQQAQGWISNHEPHNSSIYTWGGNRTNVTPWPHNHLADKDG